MADGGTGLDRLVLDLDGKRFGPAALANLNGFESLEVSLEGGRLVLSQGFVAAVGSGTFTLDVVTDAGGPGATLEGAQATAKLDIRGGAGNESITGGRGADVISDGAGADRLRGGTGADRLVLSADGAADRLVYGAAGEGSRDIAIAANSGLLAEADTIIGFNAAGDTGNVLEFTRAGFLGLGSKTAIVDVAAGGALDLSTGVVFLIHASNAVAGGFADRTAINAAFASRLAAGDAGHAGFVIARGTGGTDAALYYVRERDGLAGMADDDQLVLLAVLSAPGALGASDFVLG
jgi:Ca2+-binding RTX toxin-like protein